MTKAQFLQARAKADWLKQHGPTKVAPGSANTTPVTFGRDSVVPSGEPAMRFSSHYRRQREDK